MLERVHLNHKSVRDLHIKFSSKFTCLVGPNGSGKTAVLEMIDRIGDGELIDQTASSPHTYKEVNSIVYNSPIGENGKGARCVSNILYHMRKSYSIHLIVGTMDAYLPILIDNIEAHLHPTSQRLLIQYIREHSERQLICSTHSPYVVSCFKPEEVIMLKLDASGNTVTMPLSEHPDLPQWKDSLDTGEFWSFVWDRW